MTSYGGGKVGVKGIPGRQKITDDEIRELLRKGWFISQIMGKYKAGCARIQKIDREMQQETAGA